MKKYKVMLGAFFILFGLLFTNVSSVGATTPSSEEGCTSSGPYNIYTGQLCVNSPVRIDCLPGHIFNSTTGRSCDGNITPSPDIDDSDSCVYVYKDLAIGSRGDEVRAFQQMLKNRGFLSGKVDGIYGPVTDGASTRYQRICPLPTPRPLPVPAPNAPVVSGVSGPQTLKVGEQGTWTVKASSPNGGNLSYSVSWGDEGYQTTDGLTAFMPAQQTATFTHRYARAGVYTPTFTVTNTMGGGARTSLSVKVGSVTTAGSIIATLDPSSPLSTSLEPGQVGVSFSRIKLLNNSNSNVTLNNIQVSSDNVLADNFIKNIKIFKGATQIGATFSNVAWNGSYYYHWVPATLTLTPYSSTVLTIKADVLSTASVGAKMRLGIAGLNFNSPGATVDGLPVYGNYMDVDGANSSSLTVLSPNGGETWTKGTTQTIRWSDSTGAICYSGRDCLITNVSKSYDINLVPYIPSCVQGQICATPSISPHTLAKNILGSSYQWAIPNCAIDTECSSNFDIRAGSYTIQVCQSGTTVCDSSNSHFQIVSPVSTQPLVINASRHGSSPSGNVSVGTVNAELFRINLKASGQNATVNQLSFGLNGSAVAHVSNIRVFDETVKTQFGTLSNLTNTSSWFYTGKVNTSGLTIPAGATKTLSIRGNVSSNAFSSYASPCASCSYWMYMNLTDVSTSSDSDVSISGLPVTSLPINIPYGAPALGLNQDSTVIPGSRENLRLQASAISAFSGIATSDPVSSPVNVKTQSFVFTKFLVEGSSGGEVRELQKFLNASGYDAGTVDGIFGPKVKTALTQLQTDNNLKADGIAGYEVRTFLNK